jgi:glyoxalase-like protein
MICVPELGRGVEAYRRLGFDVHPGGEHPGKGTHNAIAFGQDDYLELLALRNREEYRANSAYGGLLEFLEQGGGLRYVVVQSDDLAADAAAMRARGVELIGPIHGARRTPSGQELRWKAAHLGERNPLPVFFIQHVTPLTERRRQVPAAGRHPNGMQRIERCYIVVDDLEAALGQYRQMLGVEPQRERGTVINADMAIFPLGPTGLGVVRPVAPGVAANALARRGPGPFQVLYRTTGMDAAAKWIADHGLPSPARGTRNTGEQAMLVPPEHACGVYVGFVGMP